MLIVNTLRLKRGDKQINKRKNKEINEENIDTKKKNRGKIEIQIQRWTKVETEEVKSSSYKER